MPKLNQDFEQTDAVGADDDCDHGIGAGGDRSNGRAIVLGADRIPDDLGDLAAELLEGLHHAQRHFVAPRVVLTDEGDVARAELFVEIVAERMADLARRHRGANHGRGAVPFGDAVGACGIHHQRNAGFLADLRHGRAFMPAERADHDMHLLLVHQATRLRDRLVGIAGRIRNHVFDLASAGHVADLVPVQFEAVDHVDSRRREWAGEWHQQAYLDRSCLLRSRCRAERGREQRGAGRADEIPTRSCRCS